MKWIKILLFQYLVLIGFYTKAQVSLVPANHQVYDWLHKQRILGNIRYYSFETLPLSRGKILNLLNEIEKESGLSNIDKSHLNTYLLEFSMDSLRATSDNTLLKGKASTIKGTWNSKWKLLKSNVEPHLYTHVDSNSILNVDYYYGTGTQESDSDQPRSVYRFNGIRLYGSFHNRLGIYLETVYSSLVQSGTSLRNVDYWGTTPNALDGHRESIYYEGSASVNYKKLSLHIGNGNIKYGVGNDESMIFRLKAPNFNWVRLNYDSKYFNYTFLHGKLLGATQLKEDPLNPGMFSEQEVLRWLSMRRLQIKPFKWLQMAFTEVLTYSNRGIELSYINPVYPLRIGEFNRSDLDNPVWYLDGNIFPLKGVEFYATLGIDDLNSFSDVFKSTGNRSNETAVLSYQAGMHISPKGLFHLNFQYSRIDPFFYTHKFHNNTFINSLEHEISLGSGIGPNSDQWYLSVRKWLKKRAWIKGYFSTVRKGLNSIDMNGEVTLNAGGSIGLGRSDGNTIVRFLSGDLHEFNVIGMEGYVEPWRGVAFSFNYNKQMVTKGDRIKSADQFGMRILITFYPLTRVLNPLIPRSSSIHGWL